MRKIKRVIKWVITAALCLVLGYCGCRIASILDGYRQEAALHGAWMAYRPEIAADPAEAVTAMREINGDITGWIAIDNTAIDYPFVQAADNSYYLNRNVYGEEAAAGTLFLDYRCAPSFSSFNSILYGHHMKNASMFGDLKKFTDAAFFAENTTGTLFLEHGAYRLDIFCCLVVSADNALIYNTLSATEAEQAAYLAYVAANAQHYRDLPLDPGDTILTLSTCDYTFDDARIVVLARIGDRT